MAMAVIKIQVSDPGPSLPSCLLMEVIYLLALLVKSIYIDQNLKKKNLQFSESPLLVGRKVDLLNVIIRIRVHSFCLLCAWCKTLSYFAVLY